MWNNTDTPLAYLITFRTYGTWLHGDRRGSIDRHNNDYGSPRYRGNDHWERITESRTKHEPVLLTAARRHSVEAAIRDTCRIRNWDLSALNVRTNHVHLVASIGDIKPQSALAAFKANATRQMREDGCWPHAHSPWAQKGSTRYLWNERSVGEAVFYVLAGQGGELPSFD